MACPLSMLVRQSLKLISSRISNVPWHKRFTGVPSVSKRFTSTPCLELPIKMLLRDNKYILINRMTDSHMTSTFELMNQAAQEGDGYGISEYNNEADFRHFHKNSHGFVLTNLTHGEEVGFIIIDTSPLARYSKIASVIVILKPSYRHQKLGNQLAFVIEDLMKKLGFSGVYMDPFSNNKAVIRLLEKNGYTKIATLPVGGLMSDGSRVSVDLYYKDL